MLSGGAQQVAQKHVQLEDLPTLITQTYGPDTFQVIISNQNMPRQVRQDQDRPTPCSGLQSLSRTEAEVKQPEPYMRQHP